MVKKIKLGNKVKCTISGFTGIATAKVKYINGCIQYCVTPKVNKEGNIVSGEYFDEKQVEWCGEGVVVETKPTGGVQRDCPRV